MAEQQSQGRYRDGITVTNTKGTVTIGDHNRVTTTVGEAGPAREPEQEELLLAVRRLRADLGGVVPSERTVALDTELAGTEEEIESEGAATPGRAARLRQALTDAASVTGVLASGVAVGEALGGLF
ncbi:hypothetical protein [Streptomyces sp. NPDC090025]|uniref:hypothetical protein n=1 Tax=Streptomyces sp. NPDC090025 TaxID=3365922 RepID=UPI0038395E22